MNKSSDLMLLYRIAQSYYKEGKSQNEIALAENISRSQISRLLKRATELGIVRFDVSLPNEIGRADMEAVLKSALKLQEVIIAPVPAGVSEQEEETAITEAIATAAAAYLPKELKGCRTVGIGWGRTMYTTSLMLSYQNIGDKLTYVPLIGLSGTNEPYLQINTIIDRMSEKHRAHSYFTGVLAFRERAVPLSYIENARKESLRQYWDCLDAAVVGLGAPPPGLNYLPEISAEHLSVLEKWDTCGDILAQYYTEDGRVYNFGDEYSRMGFNITKLPSVPAVICLAGGRTKARGIVAAARLRFVSRLITDSLTAKHIMNLLDFSDLGAS